MQFLSGRRGRVVGNIVGYARKPVESENGRTVARLNQIGRDGKILVTMPLARGKSVSVARFTHAMAWARPFHMPPLPRQNCSAESIVNAVYNTPMAGNAKPHSGVSR